jgi:hypothetical protein
MEEAEFDRWHDETCKMFLDNLNGDDGDKDHFPIYKDLKYGKAQKIVNMMFKHLYCFNSEEKWEIKWAPYFKYCHVTLDNFTLEWFKRNVSPYQRIDSWSNLEYLQDPEDKRGYLFYQKRIRNFFAEQPKNSVYGEVTPFQAEFYIWPEIQLRLAAEAFIQELNPEDYKGKDTDPTKNRAGIRELSMNELVARVKHEIQKFEEKQS